MKVSTYAYEKDGKFLMNDVSVWIENKNYVDFRETFPSAKFIEIDEILSGYEHWRLGDTNIRIKL